LFPVLRSAMKITVTENQYGYPQWFTFRMKIRIQTSRKEKTFRAEQRIFHFCRIQGLGTVTYVVKERTSLDPQFFSGYCSAPVGTDTVPIELYCICFRFYFLDIWATRVDWTGRILWTTGSTAASISSPRMATASNPWILTSWSNSLIRYLQSHATNRNKQFQFTTFLLQLCMMKLCKLFFFKSRSLWFPSSNSFICWKKFFVV